MESQVMSGNRDPGLIDLLYEVIRVSATAFDEEQAKKSQEQHQDLQQQHPHISPTKSPSKGGGTNELVEKLTQKIQALQSEIESTKREHTTILTKVEECIKAELLQRQLDEEQAKSLVANLNQQIANLQLELEETRSQYTHNLAEIQSRVAAELIAAQRTKEESDARIDQLENTLRILNESNCSNAHEISNEETGKDESEINSLKKNIEMLSEEVLTLKRTNLQFAEQCESIDKARKDAESRLKDMQNSMQELNVVKASLKSTQQSNEMLKKQITTLQGSLLDKDTRLDVANKSLYEKDQQLQFLNDMWETSRRKQEMSAREMIALRTEISAERSTMASDMALLRSESETLRQAFASSNSKVSSLQKDLGDNYQRLSTTMETLSQRDKEIIELQDRNEKLLDKVCELEEISDTVMKRLISYQLSGQLSASPSKDDGNWREKFEDANMELLRTKKLLKEKEEVMQDMRKRLNDKDEMIAKLQQVIFDKKTPPLTPLRQKLAGSNEINPHITSPNMLGMQHQSPTRYQVNLNQPIISLSKLNIFDDNEKK